MNVSYVKEKWKLEEVGFGYVTLFGDRVCQILTLLMR